MIDLNRNRAELLAEIEGAEPQGEPLGDLTDPRVASEDTHVRVLGHAKKDLFPLLKLALSERFAWVQRPQLNRDLLIPLRNALGNAHKHGNAKNPTGIISVGIVLSRKGALVTVTDEGAGFDVADTFRRFQQQQDYCMNRGAGFRNLHQAKSTVSYQNGGRTLLLCFRPASPGDTFGTNHPRQEPDGKIRESPLVKSLPKVLDPEWIQTCLSSELPEFRDGQARLESCRVYAIRGPADDGCGNRYVLRVASHGGQPAQTRILTGRLHATEAAAEADFEAAKSLHDAAMTKRLLIPRPVARLKAEPRLVLYDFDPWLNLREYLTLRPDLKLLGHAAERIGTALAGLHRSRALPRSMETMSEGRDERSAVGTPENLRAEEFRALVEGAESNLATLPGGPGLVNQLRVYVGRIQEWAELSRPRTVALIHGALDWGCIHFGGDRRFYLYRFETCRRSDPGLDLGRFAADLLCFTLAHHNEEVYRICHDTFLTKYNAEAEHPMAKDLLRCYIALALVERLGRAECRSKAEARQLLGALDAELDPREVIALSEVPS